jgi:hypothetical protein
MKSSALFAVALACLFAGSAVYAQQASAPAGSTGQCKDGSYTSNAAKKGSCTGHKGVKEWYTATSAKSASGAAPMAAPAAAAAPAANTAMKPSPAMPAPAAAAAAGGGPGQVWVNTSSKTKAYHCQGSKWYGTTKQGKYMSASDAQAAGYHATKGDKCS